ncbi:winged helix-turn-helix transcriptional regulator [Luteolibacter soli]|uniref:Helix-turn-helix domain-containing protein n=1 Tax=Luteolibacter soli TaxID=3135280 RepID=A0ABU9AUW9_9BACT
MPAKPKSQSLPRRSPCPVACALDLLGDRWTMLVIRDLFLGKQRFDEFLASPEGIATNILADRLKHLHEQGLVTKTPDDQDRRRFHYQLTPTGKSLHEVIIPLARWGLANLPKTKLHPAAAKALR